MYLVSVKKTKLKRYLKDTLGYSFNGLYEFLKAFFELYEKGTQDLEAIEILLEEIGYNNIKDIPISEYPKIRVIIQQKAEDWQSILDSEYCSYLILDAWQKGRIIIFINDAIIENLNEPITIHEDTIICFIDKEKINNINFKKQ